MRCVSDCMPVGAQAEVARDDGLGLEDLGALVLRDEVGEALRLARGRGCGGCGSGGLRTGIGTRRGRREKSAAGRWRRLSIDWLMSKSSFRGAG